MDDLGINRWLLDNYGKTVDGHPLFRLLWTTNVTEKRYSEFHDYYGEIFIRAVREIRECLKYPFAQDRWVLERICPISQAARDAGLRTDEKYDYVEIYTFQDRDGNMLPLTRDKVETALYLFFNFYLKMNLKQRTDLRMQLLAQRELEKRNKTRDAIGELRSPLGFVLDRSSKK